MAFGITPDIFFKKIGVEQGLSHRKVNCIIQDRRGFLWFGTDDGLNRFDGKYFVSFRYQHHNKGCISGNIISDIYEDKDGLLWIATQDGGMSRYDYRLPAARQFKQFRHNPHNPDGIPENTINKIAEDASGNLWLGTSSHFTVRFNKKTERFDIPVKKGTRCVYALAMTDHDTLLIGRAGGGLMKINTRTLEVNTNPKYDDLYAKLPHVTITTIFKDQGNNIWLGSWDKAVYRLDAATGEEQVIGRQLHQKSIPPDDYVSFANSGDSGIWMAGKNTGLVRYEPRTQNITRYRHEDAEEGSIADDHVNVVYRDFKGVLWVGTNNGISMYNPLFKPFVQYQLPDAATDVITYDFYQLDNGRLLIGTSNGLYYKHEKTGKLTHLPLKYRGQRLAVTKFYMDVDQRFYIGTDYTLFRFDPYELKLWPLPHTDEDPVMKKLISSRIVSIVRDTLEHHPVLWVSPYGHFLAYYDLHDQRWVSRADSGRTILKRYNIADNLIRKIIKDRKGNLLLATFKTGMGLFEGGKKPIRYFMNDTENRYTLSSNDVFDIQEDYSGNLWVSTFGGGVNFYSYRRHKFYHLSESSNLTEGMQLDQQDNLWMLCNGHIHKYDPLTRVYSCYDLPRLQHTGGVTGYIFRDRQGTFYAAGVNYYITFRPEAVAKIRPDPMIYFTDFRVHNKSFNQFLYQKKVELNYTENQISIEYAAPEYSGDNLQYAYMLEGFDKDWVIAGKKNIAEYANLKGGNYKFKVRATNWKGSFTEKQSEIFIIITPPYWQRSWFFILMIFLVGGLIYLIYRYRINVLLEQQAIRNGIAQDLHDQVGATLSSISLYSEVARKHQEHGNQTQLNQVLNIISNTANEMVSEMGDIVWAINPGNDHIESVFNRIRQYAEPLCAVKKIDFKLRYDPGIVSGTVDMRVRKNLYLIIKEGINNAIKHSQCRHLMVSLLRNGEIVELMICDDGIGFNLEQALIQNSGMNGNGVKNIWSRAEDMKADIKIDSGRSAGTSICICFNTIRCKSFKAIK
ncbi:sensor histidine kinase [Mucilaginibacter defluvii]|uniref:Two component regulator with propeller domain n=1 Tax=Mucilaginibacter defluvii TaxID=1196019 RepID=A0ABP9G459_9SPHI